MTKTAPYLLNLLILASLFSSRAAVADTEAAYLQDFPVILAASRLQYLAVSGSVTAKSRSWQGDSGTKRGSPHNTGKKTLKVGFGIHNLGNRDYADYHPRNPAELSSYFRLGLDF
ncbi:MAG: hypothetical protein CSA54_04450 [Gammaproteobacteria bacterium]|nr:MAG: hypothetical protein CSA54_04450 [Gammaproteobacteria bacterium]